MRKPMIGKRRDPEPELLTWPIKLFVKGSLNWNELQSFSRTRPGTLLLPVAEYILAQYEALTGEERNNALAMIVREMDYAYGCANLPPFEFRTLRLGVNFQIPPTGVTFQEVP